MTYSHLTLVCWNDRKMFLYVHCAQAFGPASQLSSTRLVCPLGSGPGLCPLLPNKIRACTPFAHWDWALGPHADVIWPHVPQLGSTLPSASLTWWNQAPEATLPLPGPHMPGLDPALSLRSPLCWDLTSRPCAAPPPILCVGIGLHITLHAQSSMQGHSSWGVP